MSSSPALHLTSALLQQKQWWLSGLLLVWMASGCGEEARQEAERREYCQRRAEQQVFLTSRREFFVSGRPLELSFSFFTGCSEQLHAEVLGPDGQPVALFQQQSPAEGQTFRMNAQVRFVPPQPGTYTLRTRVEGTPGTLETALLVVAERQVQVQELERWCLVVYRMASGAVLCDEQVLRDGVEVQALTPGAQRAIAGNVVWELEGGHLRRLVDRGEGALVMEPAASLDVEEAGVETLHATEDELVVVHGRGKLARYVRDSSGLLAQAGQASYPYFSAYPMTHLVLRVPGRVVLVATYGGNSSMSAACTYSSAGDGLTQVPWKGPSAQQWNGCQFLAGIAFGLADGGVWTLMSLSMSAQRTFRFFRPRDDTFELALEWEAPVEFAFQALSSEHPVASPVAAVRSLAPGWFLLRAGEHGAHLERISLAESFEFRRAHDGLAYEVSLEAPQRTRLLEL
jgi:hypothetical protein